MLSLLLVSVIVVLSFPLLLFSVVPLISVISEPSWLIFSDPAFVKVLFVVIALLSFPVLEKVSVPVFVSLYSLYRSVF